MGSLGFHVSKNTSLKEVTERLYTERKNFRFNVLVATLIDKGDNYFVSAYQEGHPDAFATRGTEIGAPVVFCVTRRSCDKEFFTSLFTIDEFAHMVGKLRYPVHSARLVIELTEKRGSRYPAPIEKEFYKVLGLMDSPTWDTLDYTQRCGLLTKGVWRGLSEESTLRFIESAGRLPVLNEETKADGGPSCLNVAPGISVPYGGSLRGPGWKLFAGFTAPTKKQVESGVPDSRILEFVYLKTSASATPLPLKLPITMFPFSSRDAFEYAMATVSLPYATNRAQQAVINAVTAAIAVSKETGVSLSVRAMKVFVDYAKNVKDCTLFKTPQGLFVGSNNLNENTAGFIPHGVKSENEIVAAIMAYGRLPRRHEYEKSHSMDKPLSR